MLRFTIRDLLWLTLVVGLAVGWWVDHAWQAKRYANLQVSQRFEISESQATLVRDWIAEDQAALENDIRVLKEQIVQLKMEAFRTESSR